MLSRLCRPQVLAPRARLTTAELRRFYGRPVPALRLRRDAAGPFAARRGRFCARILRANLLGGRRHCARRASPLRSGPRGQATGQRTRKIRADSERLGRLGKSAKQGGCGKSGADSARLGGLGRTRKTLTQNRRPAVRARVHAGKLPKAVPPTAAASLCNHTLYIIIH